MNALVKPQAPAKMMALKASDLNLDMLEKIAQALSGGSNRMPGELLQFKKGQYLIGTGPAKQRKKLKLGTALGANVPNIVMFWQKFENGVPRMESLSHVMAGEVVCPRVDLGDNDKTKWEQSKDELGNPEVDANGEPVRMDPWQSVLCLMLVSDSGELYRLEVSTYSAKAAVGAFVAEYAKEAKRKGLSKLPIIEIETEVKDRKGANQTYHVPMLNIIDWVEASDLAFPEGGIELGTPAAEDDGEPSDVVATARTNKPAVTPAAAQPATQSAAANTTPAASRFAKARAEAVDVTADDDVPPPPRSGFGKKKAV